MSFIFYHFLVITKTPYSLSARGLLWELCGCCLGGTKEDAAEF